MYLGKGNRSFHARYICTVSQRAFKLLNVKVRGLKKTCHPVLALVEPLGQSLTPTGSKSFSKFDGWQFCSPLTYRPFRPGTAYLTKLFRKLVRTKPYYQSQLDPTQHYPIRKYLFCQNLVWTSL